MCLGYDHGTWISNVHHILFHFILLKTLFKVEVTMCLKKKNIQIISEELCYGPDCFPPIPQIHMLKP